MKQALTYSLKVWLTAVVLSPILIVIFLPDPNHADRSLDFVVTCLVMLVGAICSLPSALLFYLTSRVVYKLNILYKKAILTLVSTILTYLPFVLAKGIRLLFDTATIIVIGSYYIVIVAGIWLYKLKGLNEESANVTV